MFFLLSLLACSGSDDSDVTDTPDTEVVDTDAAECATVNAGTDWAWNGECPQMRTPCDIVVDGCSLAIDYAADGGMTMGMPYSGTIAGSTVTFADGDEVTGCVGTVVDADTIEGTCGDGCTFTLER